MKKTLLGLVALLAIVSLSAPAKADPCQNGSIYESTTVPFSTGIASTYSKVGSATCKNVLNVVQWGSCGINDAMKSANIKTIHHSDITRDGSFVFKKITTNVYGE